VTGYRCSVLRADPRGGFNGRMTRAERAAPADHGGIRPSAQAAPAAHAHGLPLRPWDAGSETGLDAWFRRRTDPEFRRWNTPPRNTTDLDIRAAGAASLRVHDRPVPTD
jgi:hypothetical protein